MTTSSAKAELHLSYARSEDGHYRAYAEVLREEDPRKVCQLKVTRGEMIEWFVEKIREYKPDRVAVVHDGNPSYISKETLNGIRNGTLNTDDLLIGS